LRTFLVHLSGMPPAEKDRRLRRVPLLVWANFALPREEPELSVNALPSYLLENMRIPPPGFLAVSDAVRRRLPIVAKYVQGADGRVWNRDSLPTDERQLLEDYRLLQYDVLLGKRYSIHDNPGTASSCGGAMQSQQVSNP
jgi:hypothetical protein